MLAIASRANAVLSVYHYISVVNNDERWKAARLMRMLRLLRIFQSIIRGAAARRKRSLIASPNPSCGMGATAMQAGFRVSSSRR